MVSVPVRPGGSGFSLAAELELIAANYDDESALRGALRRMLSSPPGPHNPFATSVCPGGDRSPSQIAHEEMIRRAKSQPVSVISDLRRTGLLDASMAIHTVVVARMLGDKAKLDLLMRHQDRLDIPVGEVGRLWGALSSGQSGSAFWLPHAVGLSGRVLACVLFDDRYSNAIIRSLWTHQAYHTTEDTSHQSGSVWLKLKRYLLMWRDAGVANHSHETIIPDVLRRFRSMKGWAGRGMRDIDTSSMPAPYTSAVLAFIETARELQLRVHAARASTRDAQASFTRACTVLRLALAAFDQSSDMESDAEIIECRRRRADAKAHLSRESEKNYRVVSRIRAEHMEALQRALDLIRVTASESTPMSQEEYDLLDISNSIPRARINTCEPYDYHRVNSLPGSPLCFDQEKKRSYALTYEHRSDSSVWQRPYGRNRLRCSRHSPPIQRHPYLTRLRSDSDGCGVCKNGYFTDDDRCHSDTFTYGWDDTLGRWWALAALVSCSECSPQVGRTIYGYSAQLYLELLSVHPMAARTMTNCERHAPQWPRGSESKRTASDIKKSPEFHWLCVDQCWVMKTMRFLVPDEEKREEKKRKMEEKKRKEKKGVASQQKERKPCAHEFVDLSWEAPEQRHVDEALSVAAAPSSSSSSSCSCSSSPCSSSSSCSSTPSVTRWWDSLSRGYLLMCQLNHVLCRFRKGCQCPRCLVYLQTLPCAGASIAGIVLEKRKQEAKPAKAPAKKRQRLVEATSEEDAEEEGDIDEDANEDDAMCGGAEPLAIAIDNAQAKAELQFMPVLGGHPPATDGERVCQNIRIGGHSPLNDLAVAPGGTALELALHPNVHLRHDSCKAKGTIGSGEDVDAPCYWISLPRVESIPSVSLSASSASSSVSSSTSSSSSPASFSLIQRRGRIVFYRDATRDERARHRSTCQRHPDLCVWGVRRCMNHSRRQTQTCLATWARLFFIRSPRRHGLIQSRVTDSNIIKLIASFVWPEEYAIELARSMPPGWYPPAVMLWNPGPLAVCDAANTRTLDTLSNNTKKIRVEVARHSPALWPDYWQSALVWRSVNKEPLAATLSRLEEANSL